MSGRPWLEMTDHLEMTVLPCEMTEDHPLIDEGLPETCTLEINTCHPLTANEIGSRTMSGPATANEMAEENVTEMMAGIHVSRIHPASPDMPSSFRGREQKTGLRGLPAITGKDLKIRLLTWVIQLNTTKVR